VDSVLPWRGLEPIVIIDRLGFVACVGMQVDWLNRQRHMSLPILVLQGSRHTTLFLFPRVFVTASRRPNEWCFEKRTGA
jgi:hypothetical protein